MQARAALMVMSAIVLSTDDALAVADNFQDLCAKSGYEIGSSENKVCTTLIKAHPPKKDTSLFNAVSRSIYVVVDGKRVRCSLLGGEIKLVSCKSKPLMQAKTK